MLYTIKLMDFHNDEIIMIDLCMRLCGLDISQASKCVDHMPSIIASNVDEAKAAEIKKEFESNGATIQLFDESDAEGAGETAVESQTSYPQQEFYEEPGQAYTDDGNYYQQETYMYGDDYDQNMDFNEDDFIDPTYQPQQQEYDQGYVTYEEYGEDAQSQPVVSIKKEPEAMDVGTASVVEAPAEESYETFFGSCPRCGSTFVSVKKGNALFGNTKLKYICDACKHKF